MIKTTAVLFVCSAALVACAHQEPAQSAQVNSGTPTASYAGTTTGATERMPEPASTSTPAPATAPGESAPRASAPATSPATGAQPEPWTDGRILEVIHSIDRGEIAQSELARTRATDGRVRRFAAAVMNDHTVADEEAQATAKRSGTTFELSPTSRNLATDARSSTDGLEGQAGGEFDRAYIGAQIAEDQAVLGTIDDDLMPNAQSTDVKHLLTRVRGKVLTQLQHAQDIFAALTR